MTKRTEEEQQRHDNVTAIYFAMFAAGFLGLLAWIIFR